MKKIYFHLNCEDKIEIDTSLIETEPQAPVEAEETQAPVEAEEAQEVKGQAVEGPQQVDETRLKKDKLLMKHLSRRNHKKLKKHLKLEEKPKAEETPMLKDNKS